ncbi:unnamed protein product, partial [Mesorhabditis belari]|uniref:Tr-type G domain-containing protein n=1 Tax=Mesorhabditis belari TaxID=2138241 RepID=A0AAF3J7D1_9BILA
MSGWNLNAATFVPNANARPFVPGQQYQAPPAEPQQAWDAEPEPAETPAQVPAPVETTPAAPQPAVVSDPVEKPAPLPEVEKAEVADVVAPLNRKFERATIDPKSRKEHVNLVFIGHVDAGKSTIGGQIMFQTGMVDKRTLEKYERDAKEKGRESWYLSWCMDTNEEERDKGKTVECGRAFFETERKHFTILDAPGHKSFVPNMITGATQADLAVLVISARKGEFETGFDRGGQTREHALLVKTAGVRHLIILVNKMDDPTVEWDQGRWDEIQSKLTPYLKKCGFNPKTDITYIPVSGLTGDFIKDRPSDSTKGGWYGGPCFIEYIDHQIASINRDFEGPVRCIITDKYSEMGTIAFGKMESGVIEKNQTLLLSPNKTLVQITQCWCDDAEVDKVAAGDNVKLKLKGVEESDLQSGFILSSPDAPVKVGRIFDAEVVVMDYKSIIAPGYSCVLHIQSAVEEVSVKLIIATIDKKTGEKKRAKFVKQDDKCIIRFESPEPFCLEPFKELPQLGRFTLRDEGKTLAIGKVLKVVE